MRLDTTEKLVILGDNNTVTLNLQNFKGEMNASYMYITEPPLLADVGDFNWQFNDTSLRVGGVLYLDEHFVPQISLDEMDIYALPFEIQLDGVSDLSEVVSSLVTFAGNVARNRVISLSHYLEQRNSTWL